MLHFNQLGSTTGPVTSPAASGQEEMGEEKFLLGEPLSFYLFHLTNFYILNFQLNFFISWAFLATTELLNTAKQLEVSLPEVKNS